MQVDRTLRLQNLNPCTWYFYMITRKLCPVCGIQQINDQVLEVSPCGREHQHTRSPTLEALPQSPVHWSGRIGICLVWILEQWDRNDSADTEDA